MLIILIILFFLIDCSTITQLLRYNPVEVMNSSKRYQDHLPYMDRTMTEPDKRSIQTSKGLIIVNTGKGKGKRTAALGILFRAWGQDMRVCMIQFILITKKA